MPETILIVEDELSLRETLAYNLQKAGYLVNTTGNGREALRLGRELQPDLILLDIMLPEMDGLEITRILRRDSNVPILMLTARDDEIDRVLGLELGADDYLTKPFSMRELLARVKAMLRRSQYAQDPPGADSPQKPFLVFGDLVIDPVRHEVRLRGEAIRFKPKEYDLLLHLAEHAGQVFSREQILARVWGWDYVGGTRTVDVHVRWIRAKIENDSANPVRLVTVRGAGYRFDG